MRMCDLRCFTSLFSFLSQVWARRDSNSDTMVRSHVLWFSKLQAPLRLHLIHSRENPKKKGIFPLPSHFELRRCECVFVSIRTARCVPRCQVGEEGCHKWRFEQGDLLISHLFHFYRLSKCPSFIYILYEYFDSI